MERKEENPACRNDHRGAGCAGKSLEFAQQAVRLSRHELPLDLVLKRFVGLFITDSTVAALPVALRDEFAGGSAP